jgi:acyl-CoA synthetase (AMP-forming)/AMP-acid ligase II
MAKKLYRSFQKVAAERSRAPAVTFLDSVSSSAITYTYGELFDRVEQLGARLAARYDDDGAPLGLLLGSQDRPRLRLLAT